MVAHVPVPDEGHTLSLTSILVPTFGEGGRSRPLVFVFTMRNTHGHLRPLVFMF